MLTSSNYRHVVDIDYSVATPMAERLYPCFCGVTRSGFCVIEDWDYYNCPGTVHDDEGAIKALRQRVRELEDQVAELTRVLLSAADQLDVIEKDWANQDG